MDAIDAQKILQSLAQGFDPVTGECVAAHEVVRRAEVLQALAVAVAALEQEAVRARRRAALPPNVGARWTDAATESLLQAFRAGTPLDVIAVRQGRSLRSIEARLEILGELRPSERSTRNLFARPRHHDSS